MYDKDKPFLRALCEYHGSGQLKVAPEHISNAVLSRLGKPSVEVYNSFVKAYKDMNKKIGKEQYLVPYLMSSHPGSTLKEAIELVIKKSGSVSEIELTITEGKFHQVKRMFEALGKRVIYLKRISMGPLKLPDDLKTGTYRALTQAETDALMQINCGK